MQLRTPIISFVLDLDGIYNGKHVILKANVPKEFSWGEVETEYRVIRGTKVMYIGDYLDITEMQQDKELYHNLKSKALIRVNNPDYLDFTAYTEKVLNDKLKPLEDVTSINPEQARKYMDYAVAYDKDKQHSDKLIQKSYFTSFDGGVLILTDDFKDFNLNLQISPQFGVVGCEIWISDNSSHYLKNYKEI